MNEKNKPTILVRGGLNLPRNLVIYNYILLF
jgi:hypothetical protein